MATSWFSFVGTTNSNPNDYLIVSGNPTCCTPKAILCAIFAEVQFIDFVERPIITGTLQAEINAALSGTPTESSNVRLKPN